MENQPKGKTLLKVVSILLIIGAVVTFILSLISILGGSAVAAGTDEVVGGLFILLGIVSLIMGILQLITGIVGVKNAGNTEKEAIKKCQIWGIVILMIAVINIAITLIINQFSITTLFSLLLPILFMVGVNMNKQSTEE
ncbi:hypothetical protein [Anaerofustis stercorihominis]|uniref:Uncharacterized protein n=1 Tax=Anaerofustis stercorihominis TaxID=214853 RepID=A0A3E3DZC2_9FIRM|nr:hypothetical protein [Anaerofustis stercorihominis]RGD74426.1 hypothetical protein DW687_06575 [Anaerofustis stercorihominis]